MPAVRIRQPFAAPTLDSQPRRFHPYGQSDKGLHFFTFFLLTITFYWILETSRRRCIHLTLIVVTAGLSISSEVVQAFLPNGRTFDPYDILANALGSAPALFLCSWYHKRMLERKRKNKHYDIVPGEDVGEDGEERDVELGTVRDQETGVIEANGQATAGAAKTTTVSEELDNWDENAEDWDDDADPTVAGDGKGVDDAKKRED